VLVNTTYTRALLILLYLSIELSLVFLEAIRALLTLEIILLIIFLLYILFTVLYRDITIKSSTEFFTVVLFKLSRCINIAVASSF
jgi:hypothetical protein